MLCCPSPRVTAGETETQSEQGASLESHSRSEAGRGGRLTFPREKEDASGTGGLAPSHSPCLSFQICEMGTLLGSVEITGLPGKRLQGLIWPT